MHHIDGVLLQQRKDSNTLLISDAKNMCKFIDQHEKSEQNVDAQQIQMVDVTTAEDVQRKQLSPHNSNNE
jgi:hypothetical protein